MAAEEVLLLDIFDSIWFGHKIAPSEKPNQHQDRSIQQLDHQDHDDHFFSAPQNLKVRSLSEQLLDSKIGSFFSSDNSLSPSSAKLETIFSGKEVKDYDDHDHDQEEPKKVVEKKNKKKRRSRNKRASKLGLASKSLTELEFEELKGFMDLGFVFTEEECKDSKLVSMIPGLQRYCQKCSATSPDHHHHHHHNNHDHHEAHDDQLDEEGCDKNSHKGVISRPYLSEAWDVLEQREKKEQNIAKPLVIDWKISATLGNEIYMKDQLKFWAHTVASTVR